jgi:hypothetical protein
VSIYANEEKEDINQFTQSVSISPGFSYASGYGFQISPIFYYSRFLSPDGYNLSFDLKAGVSYNFKSKKISLFNYGIDFNYFFTSFNTSSFFIALNTTTGNNNFTPQFFNVSITPGYRWQWQNGINLSIGLGAGYNLYANERYHKFQNYTERFFIAGKGAIGYSF